MLPARFNVLEPESVDPEFMVKPAMAAVFVFTDTVTPLLMVTVSLVVGTWPQLLHVPLVFQFPLDAAIQLAAYAGLTGNAASASMTIMMAARILAVDWWMGCLYMSLLPGDLIIAFTQRRRSLLNGVGGRQAKNSISSEYNKSNGSSGLARVSSL
jgi:hypothetical protein